MAMSPPGIPRKPRAHVERPASSRRQSPASKSRPGAVPWHHHEAGVPANEDALVPRPEGTDDVGWRIGEQRPGPQAATRSTAPAVLAVEPPQLAVGRVQVGRSGQSAVELVPGDDLAVTPPAPPLHE